MTKEGEVVAETGGIVPVPKEGGAEEDGWLESNLVDMLFLVKRLLLRDI